MMGILPKQIPTARDMKLELKYGIVSRLILINMPLILQKFALTISSLP
jgi:hypothetical protein